MEAITMAKSPAKTATASQQDRGTSASADVTPVTDARQASADQQAEFAQKALDREKEEAERVTKEAQEAGSLPVNTAGANPAPSAVMGSNGVFVEDSMKEAIASSADHPAVENNPRAGTSAIQNGIDWNDPTARDPADPKFVGQGLDLSVYGKAAG
jgi:hypothetical protein